jgi:long-chain acyl-CoA synthetase
VNLAELLLQTARRAPERTAIAVGTRSETSYRGLAMRAHAMAGALRQRYGLVPGDRVALTMTNSVDTIPAMFACWIAGLTVVPINARLHPKEFEYILDHSGARLCLCTPDLEPQIAALAGGVPGLEAILTTGSAAFRRLSEAAPIDAAEVTPDTPAWLFYTSGTTGRPKGAVLTHRNLLFASLAYYADIDALETPGALIHAAPLSHGSGLYVLPHIGRAATHVIPERGHFDPAEMAALVNHHGNASFFAAPTMITRMLNSPAAEALDPQKLRTIVYGGGPMYVADLERALALWGPRLTQIYGQGESPMTITCLNKTMHAAREHPRHAARLASVGVAFSGVEVRIAGPDEQALTTGEIGEVLTRSDCVMAGYWRNETASAETLRGGWLHTGDLGSLDGDGLLTLKDRSKDLIIRGGSNIYPREIEEVLLRHPGVVEVAVVGCPDAEWGEEVAAFVVARAATPPSAADLDALCLDNIARFKRPRHYRFVDGLPKNNYGKVLKTTLREQLTKPSDQ